MTSSTGRPRSPRRRPWRRRQSRRRDDSWRLSRSAGTNFDPVTLLIRTAGPGDLVALQTIFRRSALSNDGDRKALLDHPEHLVLPEQPVLEGRTRLAENAEGGIVGFSTVEPRSDTAE